MKDSVTEYDFDKPLDRRNGDSLKWNRYAGRDVLPLWVADMDFAAPPAVLAALEQRIAERCLGYPVPRPELVDAVLDERGSRPADRLLASRILATA